MSGIPPEVVLPLGGILSPEGLVTNFIAQFVFEGMKYLITRAHRKDHFVEALKHCLKDSAERLKGRYPSESSTLASNKLHKTLVASLSSPEIDRKTFLGILEKAGISKKIAEGAYRDVHETFKTLIEKEAVKHPEIFRAIVIETTKKIEVSVSQLVGHVSILRKEMPSIASLVSQTKVQLDRIEGKIDKIGRVCTDEIAKETSKDVKEALRRMISIEQMIARRPIYQTSSSLEHLKSSKLLKNIKTSWLRRFRKPALDTFRLIITGESDNVAKERFSRLLLDIKEERSLHDEDDLGFVIRKEITLIETSCLFGLGLTCHGLKDLEKAIEYYKAASFLGEQTRLKKTTLSRFHHWCALAYYELKDVQSALEEFDKAIKLDPKNSESYVFQGNCYYDKRKYARAIENYDKAIELKPNSAFFYNNRGSAYADLGKYDRAIIDYNKAIELDREFAMAHYGLGLVYFDLRSYEKSIEEYSKAIELNPNYAEAYNNRAASRAKLKDSNTDACIDDWEKAIQLNPNIPEPYVNLGVVYHELGKYSEALRNLNKAIEINPNLAVAYYNRGRTFANMGNYNMATKDYDHAIELDPNNILIYNARGLLFSELKHYDRALDDLNKAIEKDPKNASSYVNRGNVYYNSENYKSAAKDYRKAIKLDPTNSLAYFNLGILYHKLGKHRRSIESYTKAIQLDPNNSRVYFNRGYVYNDLEEYEKALGDLINAVKLNPKDPEVLLNRGNAFNGLMRYKEAMDDYTNAIKLNPDYAMAYYNRGNIYAQRLKLYDKAMADFNKALDLDPSYAPAYNSRGVVHYHLMHHDRALDDYNNAIRLESNEALYYRNRGIVFMERTQTKEALKDFNRALDLDSYDIESYGGRGLAYIRLKEYGKAVKDFKNAGILSVKAHKTRYAIDSFSNGFAIRGFVSNDDVLYCGIFLYALTLSYDDFCDISDEIKKKGIKKKGLSVIWESLLKRLKKETVDFGKIENEMKRKDLKLLAGFLADF